MILNQPAGEIAQCIVEFTVKLVVEAWDHPGMPIEQLTEPVLECLFHPDFHDGQCASFRRCDIGAQLTCIQPGSSG